MKEKVLNASNQASYVTVQDSTLNQTNITIDDSCSKSNSAYFMQGGKCVYTFETPDFTGIKNNSGVSEASDKTKGFRVTYTSNENCTDDAT